jgi:hypothetical protein
MFSKMKFSNGLVFSKQNTMNKVCGDFYLSTFDKMVGFRKIFGHFLL